MDGIVGGLEDGVVEGEEGVVLMVWCGVGTLGLKVFIVRSDVCIWEERGMGSGFYCALGF